MTDFNTHAAQLESASKGFDHLFQNELKLAKDVFGSEESAFHLTGMGVCSFLEAALGMEVSRFNHGRECMFDTDC